MCPNSEVLGPTNHIVPVVCYSLYLNDFSRNNNCNLTDCSCLCLQAMDLLQKPFGQSQERGALSMLMCATEPSLAGGHLLVHCTYILTSLRWPRQIARPTNSRPRI